MWHKTAPPFCRRVVIGNDVGGAEVHTLTSKPVRVNCEPTVSILSIRWYKQQPLRR